MILANNPVQSVHWLFAAFSDLSNAQLYALLQLRSAVFVVEQHCVFLDMDGEDGRSMHLLGSVNGELMAYARCVPPGVQCAQASIGRVLIAPNFRRGGVGHALVGQAVKSMESWWGVQPIKIGAQAHLADFYSQHGFCAEGVFYIEDGIPHIGMVRASSSDNAT